MWTKRIFGCLIHVPDFYPLSPCAWLSVPEQKSGRSRCSQSRTVSWVNCWTDVRHLQTLVWMINVEIRNTSFEEWELEAKKFDAVLAATIHWISPEIAYPKAAGALKDDGFLILLWNIIPEHSYEMYQVLHEVYQTYAPSLARYEGRETQEENLRCLGEIVVKSGKFRDLLSEKVAFEVTYSTADYLNLLITLSPYLKLEPQTRHSLFEALREKVEKNFGGNIQLSHLSAFHIAQKFR